jgi:glycosyltransferase involved in cell wall biosynthesis
MSLKESRKLSIFYYSDCFFFAGCEKMLAVFFSSSHLLAKYKVSFGYKYTKLYAKGLKEHVKAQIPIRRFKFLPEFIPVPRSVEASWLKCIVIKIFNRFLSWLRRPIFFYELIIFYLYFRKNRPDILHLNNGGYPGARSTRAAAIAAKLNHIEKIFMVVNSMAFGYNNLSRLMDRPIDRLVAKSVTQFVTGSLPTVARLREVLNLPENKVIAIHNGVLLPVPTESREETLNRLLIAKRKEIICSVIALFIPRQGHQVIFEAIMLLRERKFPLFDEILVLVEGFGFLEDDLLRFIENNNLQDTIKMIGREPHIGNIYNITDISIQHTLSETDLPNVISESMGWGKPVIATNIVGIPEQIIHGETGLLCEPGNANELASAIARLCSDQKLRQSMGAAGLKRYNEQFTPEIAVNNYIALYEESMGNKC